jgi:ribonuclease BN (tRNA processing enzyme)
MARHGGNTSCVEVTLSDGSSLILDAGTGIRMLGHAKKSWHGPIHILLTHLHLDHIQGLMFFPPLFDPQSEVVVWGPPSFTGALLDRLARYISAPLSPIEIRELPARVAFRNCPPGGWRIGPARVEVALVNHRGPTFGYRITDSGRTLCYMPDHEPALGQSLDSGAREWISGIELASGADLLIHDAQYLDSEYDLRLGWGHCALGDALRFGARAGVRRMMLFHHDPLRDDRQLDALGEEARDRWSGNGTVFVGSELRTVELID